MAGYLASREHEVEPARSETLTYPQHAGYKDLTNGQLADLLFTGMMTYNFKSEIAYRLRSMK